MKITYILGNGFDIQLGLNSRYSDFLKEYIILRESDSPIIREFKNYLSKQETLKQWSDAEKAMGMHIQKFSDANINEYTEQISDFETAMILYLEKEQKRCDWTKTKEIKKAFQNYLLDSPKDILNRRTLELELPTKRESICYQFLTFNYTDLIDKVVACCRTDGSNSISTRVIRGVTYNDTVGTVCHVHGNLKDQVIMGVNDESQLWINDKTELTDLLKWQCIKPLMNNITNHNWDIPARQMIQESEIIAIYGVSYGITDQIWWDEILNWLLGNKNRKLLVYVRDKTTFNPQLPWQEAIYERQKRTEILQKLGCNQDHPKFSTLLSQVFLIANTQRLSLKHIIIPEDEVEAEDPQPIRGVSALI